MPPFKLFSWKSIALCKIVDFYSLRKFTTYCYTECIFRCCLLPKNRVILRKETSSSTQWEFSTCNSEQHLACEKIIISILPQWTWKYGKTRCYLKVLSIEMTTDMLGKIQNSFIDISGFWTRSILSTSECNMIFFAEITRQSLFQVGIWCHVFKPNYLD